MHFNSVETYSFLLKCGVMCCDFVVALSWIVLLSASYYLLLHLFAGHVRMFALPRNTAQFLCSFYGRYIYFFAGEMQI